MEPATRTPDPADRLRLVDLGVSADRGPVRLGGRFAGVLTGPHNRSDAARTIAAAMVGPRPAGVEATLDHGGVLVPADSLPSPLLPPGQPVLVDRDVVRAQWRERCLARRDEVTAAHAASRLEGHRIDAALERARSRVAAPPAPKPESSPPAVKAAEASRAQPAPMPPVAPVPVPVERAFTDEQAPLRTLVATMLAELDDLQPGPLPEGALLADAWEAHAALVRLRNEAQTDPDADVDALEARVNAARAAATVRTSTVSAEVRERIERCHQAVVDTEAAAFQAKRRQRKRAIAHYEEAVAAELLALSDAGIDSYASFVAAVGQPESALDEADRRAAEAELADARTALDLALQVPDVPTRSELEERELHIRSRAAELLGHPPGADPAAELRALHAEPEGRAERIVEIGEVLRRGGVAMSGDIVASARVFVAAPPAAASSPRPVEVPAALPAPVEPVPAPALPPAPAASATRAEIEALEQERSAQLRTMQELEDELARLDEMQDTDVAGLSSDELAGALESLLASYRAGRLLAGRLPIVLDGVFDGLGAGPRAAAVQLLARTDDVQSIVVSDDPEVMQSVANAGGALVRWPETAVTVPAHTGDGAGRHPSAASGT